MWSRHNRQEPYIRVGLVLPVDAMNRIDITVASGGARLERDGYAVGEVKPGPATVVAERDHVILRSGDHAELPADVLSLAPTHDRPEGAEAATVLHGLIAGRGFHWQKRVSMAFPAAVEFRAMGDRLLVVNELPLEQYLAGVITSEMSGECPVEFLKSQVVVARSWVLVHTEDKHPGLPIDRCNDDCCQRYQGLGGVTASARSAAAATRGQAVVDARGTIIDANYSKSCGGIIEAPEPVWGVSKPGQRASADAPHGSSARRFLPVTDANIREYLTGEWLGSTDVFCSPCVVPESILGRYLGRVDEGGQYFRWRVRHRRDELEELLRRKVFARLDASTPMPARLNGLRPIARGHSGRVIRLAVDYRDDAGTVRTYVISDQYNIRDALHQTFLYSSAFDVEMERGAGDDVTAVTLVGAGWGHGAGLCQIGALGMALQGHDCEAIIRHYFEGVRLEACY